MKSKKPSNRQLSQRLKEQAELITQQRNLIHEYRRENESLKEKINTRLDTTMMQQRIQLASNLGQMIEATSKAVMFIIAKEAI